MRYKPQYEQLSVFLNQEIDPQKRIDEILKMKKHFLELGDNGTEFDKLMRVYDLEIKDARFKISLLNKSTEPKKVEILNISKLWNNAHQKTESIHKFYYSILNQSKYKTFLVPIQDVYVLPEISNRIDTAISENQFDDNVRLETHFNNYVNGFKKGYIEFLEDYPSSAISFKEDIFSAATNLFTADIDYLRTNQNCKLIPENWDVLGERIGRFYCAWCIIIKRQSFFEPLFKTSMQTPPPRKKKTPLIFSGLFKPEYRGKLNIFFDRLEFNGYIQKDRSWIIKNNINEPAKLYHYLLGKEVIDAPKFKPAIECFYKEFGCEVVEKVNGNPRATTRTNILDVGDDETNGFDKFLLSWINSK